MRALFGGRVVARARSAVAQPVRCMSAATDASVKKTALYDAHVQRGGKMVPFAGYLLPVKYKDGDIESHLHCRKAASLFDVSHMGQVRVHGKDRLKFLETLVPSDLFALKSNQTRLSVLTTETGGVIDDCMITNSAQGHVYMVVNAGCKEKDLAHMRAQLTGFNAKNSSDVTIEYIEDRSLLALQGPKAATVLQSLLVGGPSASLDLSKVDFMFHIPNVTIGGVADCLITRCGYTGEDGFEISVPDKSAVALMEKLLAVQPVLPAGLGARDSLRLEAGLCLYGHELNETISPVEADLKWLIGKRRREEGGFLGHAPIMKHWNEGAPRKRVGFLIKKGPPAREECEIQVNGQKVGIVTSGTFSPSLKKPVSMGYIASSMAKEGTAVQVIVRGKAGDAEVVPMPFVPSSYFKLPKAPKALKAAPAAASAKA